MQQLFQIFLSANLSPEAANGSAFNMIASFIAAALLIVAPASAFLIAVSQNDKLDAERSGRGR